jgi:multidrug efflux pump subunit AcrB
VTGSFFKALSLTISASLIISYFVAWMVAPISALVLLNDEDTKPKDSLGSTKRIQAGYSRILSRVLSRPWLILAGIIPLLAIGYLAYSRLGTGFMPPMDEGGFVLDYRAAAGTSLTETDRLLRQVEDIIRKTPEVETYSRRTGLQLGGGITEANEGDFFVRLKPNRKRGIEEVMDGVRGQVEHQVPGLEIEILQLMEDLIGDLTAVPQPIEIQLFSDNGQLLEETAPKVAAAIEKIDGVVDVKNGIVLAGDALEIRVDREKAALEGMEPEAVTGVLEGYLTGIVTTQVQRGPKMVSLRVWIPPARRKAVSDVEKLRVRAPDGHLFPVRRIATVTPIIGQPQITRNDLKRMVPVTGRISGRDMGSTIREVKAALNHEGFLPKEIYYSLGGLYEQQRIAFRGLVAVFGAAVVLVFVLLLYLYESFRVALAMMLTTLLAAAAVFIGLWVTGTELNITAMMGMTMVIGIVTEVGIFYYSEYSDLAGQAEADERLVLAGKNRMRPITMTTFATILALMPLALGIGSGAAMQKPLAIAIISGLVVQMPLVLIALPALLKMMGHGKSVKNSSR